MRPTYRWVLWLFVHILSLLSDYKKVERKVLYLILVCILTVLQWKRGKKGGRQAMKETDKLGIQLPTFAGSFARLDLINDKC